MTSWKIVLFVAEATALLGSPGPGIAALISIGRRSGVRRSLDFFWAMQVGLALAVVLSAAGLMAVVLSLPILTAVLAVAGTAYLLFLAVQIAIAPVGVAGDGGKQPGVLGGFLLGVANPKAWLAFIALMASNALVSSPAGDLILKAALCVVVMIVVDLVWLWFGARTRGLGLGARAERALNLVMGATIIVAALLSLGSLRDGVVAPLFNGVFA
jgi:threonine/homoserine/homoserine lactone efflux protein